MKIKFRIIIWSILFILCASLGGFGLYKDIKRNEISEEEKNTLINISNTYNNTNYVKLLKEKSILTTAEIKRNKIIVTYSDQVINKKYSYEYNNNNLKISLENPDETGWLITKILVDSISILKGNDENSTYKIFDMMKQNKISEDPSVTINYNKNNTEIIFSTINSIKVKNINYNSILNENIDNIIDFDFTYEDEDLSIVLSKSETDKIIEIKQKEKPNENTYNMLINIISIIYDEEERTNFIDNYSELHDGTSEFNNVTITNENVGDYYILKTTIKNSQE